MINGMVIGVINGMPCSNEKKCVYVDSDSVILGKKSMRWGYVVIVPGVLVLLVLLLVFGEVKLVD